MGEDGGWVREVDGWWKGGWLGEGGGWVRELVRWWIGGEVEVRAAMRGTLRKEKKVYNLNSTYIIS